MVEKWSEPGFRLRNEFMSGDQKDCVSVSFLVSKKMLFLDSHLADKTINSDYYWMNWIRKKRLEKNILHLDNGTQLKNMSKISELKYELFNVQHFRQI